MVEVEALAAGWLTPTSLFVLLNIVIATIFFTSSFGFGSNQNKHPSQPGTPAQSHPQLFRAPSLFSRVTSFNFSNTTQHHHHYSTYHPEPDETHFQARTGPYQPAPSLFSRVASFNFCRAQPKTVAQEEPAVADEGKMGIREEAGGESRAVKRETVVRGELVVAEDVEERETRKNKVLVKQRKAVGKKTKADRAGPTKTVSSDKNTEGKTKAAETGTGATKTLPSEKSREGEVDAKADDFINRFKQQLKMQRLESLLRYRTPAS